MMSGLYPLTFEPIFKQRVWGGRALERLYGKKLPPGVPIGEAWELSDRPGDESIVANGAFAGKTLRWLMEHFQREMMGEVKCAAQGRFPLLCKVLDAREKLSLQVHPPADRAAQLGGEPKTEMWFIADAEPGAELYVGLRRGTTREEFEKKINTGQVAECFHRVPVKAGDVMFLPSGRVHAIGAGLVIFEIQQNSDTTYRVFDWNRVGLDGKPRPLHIAQSLASIDFNDFEPALAAGRWAGDAMLKRRTVVCHPLFTVEEIQAAAGAALPAGGGALQVLAVVRGELIANGERISAGRFCLIPACLNSGDFKAATEATLLHVRPG